MPAQKAPAPKAVMPTPDDSKTDAFLENLLKQYPQYFDSILLHKKDWNVQIVYTQVNRDEKGVPDLKHYYYNVNAKNYFYPASTVKFPTALLALQRLNELKDKRIDRNTAMITEAGNATQTSVYNDPTTQDGRPTIANYIKKILMVSDNDAFNRLYEFLGQDYINNELHQKGYMDVQILHRLQIPLSRAENQLTNPVKFLDWANSTLYGQPMQTAKMTYEKRKETMGSAYFEGDKLIHAPMDFSGKNRICLEDLHNILISLIFPEKVTASQRFNISDDDRQFVLKYMSQYPTESIYPPYSADTAYYPAYCKFLLFGNERGQKPKNIRIFNKVGDAYGQLTDVAYIVDFDNKVEFFLSATIFCSKDGVVNKDNYDYESMGFPFMKHLGQTILNYEMKRPNKFLPDLGSMKFVYDK